MIVMLKQCLKHCHCDITLEMIFLAWLIPSVQWWLELQNMYIVLVDDQRWWELQTMYNLLIDDLESL
jgi:hypothetical protein